jgi:hypothetical protein
MEAAQARAIRYYSWRAESEKSGRAAAEDEADAAVLILSELIDKAETRAARAVQVITDSERTIHDLQAELESLASTSEASGEASRRDYRQVIGQLKTRVTETERLMGRCRETRREARREVDRLRRARDTIVTQKNMINAFGAAGWPPVAPAAAPVEDVDGHDLKPDPLATRTPAELVEAMRRYREWAGNPSFRKMAAAARRRVGASTFCSLLRSNELPTLDVVIAFIIGCRGSEEDQQRFATAWRQIVDERGKQPRADPARALRAVPTTAAG